MNNETYTYTCTKCGHTNDWGTRAARPDPTCGQCDTPHSCTEERWKPVPEWPYLVSDQGRVARQLQDGTQRIIKSHINRKNQQRFVVLHRNGDVTTILVRSAVAKLFIGPPQPGMELESIDGNKGNCSVRNLRYQSKSEAILKSYANGTRKRATYSTILTSEIYDQIQMLWATRKFSQVQLAAKFGVHNSTIKIVRNLSQPRTEYGTFREPKVSDPQIVVDALNEATNASYMPGPKRGPMRQGLVHATEILAEHPDWGAGRVARAMGISASGGRYYVKRLKAKMQKKSVTEGVGVLP
jgi:hypothetical protein